MVILILIAFILMIIIVDAFVKYSRWKKVINNSQSTIIHTVFNENSVIVPKGVYFDKTHTWVFMEKNGTVRMGIDDFLLHVTGPINKIKLKEPGEKIKKGEALLSLFQKGKHLSIKSPVSGTIKFKNNLIVNNLSLLSSSPFYEGWIYEIEPSNWQKESQFFIMTDTYKTWLKNEFARLKDFFAYNRQVNKSELTPLMLQDGGELKVNILAEFGPEIWEEFQTKFIDTSV